MLDKEASTAIRLRGVVMDERKQHKPGIDAVVVLAGLPDGLPGRPDLGKLKEERDLIPPLEPKRLARSNAATCLVTA